MFCYNNVLMFSPMEGKERTSVYLVGWANAWDWMPFWKDWCPTYQEGWCGFYNIPYAPLRSAQGQGPPDLVSPFPSAIAATP